jgi:arylsulfatase A-like enzyme
VPLIASGHRVAAPGREVDALVQSVDLFATIVALCGAPDPGSGVDSVSLLPLLLDPGAAPPRRWVYGEAFSPNGFGPYVTRDRAAGDGRYKLIRRKPGLVEFYDLATDPHEQRNLHPALDAEQQQAFDALSAVLAQLDG